jgi:hypothetical protein
MLLKGVTAAYQKKGNVARFPNMPACQNDLSLAVLLITL